MKKENRNCEFLCVSYNQNSLHEKGKYANQSDGQSN